MQFNKQKVIPVAIIIIISLVSLFKLTPLGVVLDSVFAYFIGSIRYVIYILNMIVGFIVVTYPKEVTQKRVLALSLWVVSAMIIAEIYVMNQLNFTNLPTIGELVRHYFDTQTMLITGGGLIGFVILLALKSVVSSLLAIGLIILGVYLIILEQRSSKKRKPKQQKQKPTTNKVKQNVFVPEKPKPYVPEKVDHSVLDDNPIFNDTFEDEDIMEQPIEWAAPEPEIETSINQLNDIDNRKINDMRIKLETVLDNYDLPLEYVELYKHYNNENQVAYEFKKKDNSNDIKPSDIKAMKFDIEMGLEVNHIDIRVPFENRSAIGIIVQSYDINK